MKIKYEAVFGDQALFNSAPDDAEAVGGGKPLQDALVFYEFSDGEFQYKYEAEIDDWMVSTCNQPQSVIKAMRRIIKDHKRWTWEDKKAGLLPEVGAELIHKTIGICYFVGVGLAENACWALKLQSGLIYIAAKSWCSPIETPAEKAQRLRSEWVKHAIDLYMSSPKNHVASMGDVYEAMLS